MIRPTTAADTPLILSLADKTGVFKPMEIDALRDLLIDYHKSLHATGHRSVTYEIDRQVQGFAYYAPAAMTERSWYLYWIAVMKERHSQGIGGSLLKHVEAAVREQNGRILFIETSSLDHYEPTRRFYDRQGYEETGVLRDYYSEGDHMVVFRKKM
jgi:ribosomal protein S18 acetylase RimI-like enzyme